MKNLWKKTRKIIVCTLALAFMLAMSAGAEEGITPIGTEDKVAAVKDDTYKIRFTEGVINEGEPVYLTIHKYSNNVVNTDKTGTGLPATDLPETPLSGVVFKCYKVADLATEEGAAGVSLKYKWTADASVTGVFGLENNKLYSSDELIGKLEKCNETVDGRKKVEKAVGEVNQANDSLYTLTTVNGTAEAGGMAQGLYLIVEYSAPETVAEKSAPFFVSLPMTNAGEVTIGGKTKEPGMLWQYDVHVYPKNVEEVPEVEKNIVDQKTEKEEKYETVNIGDEVTFVIRATIPEHIDTMSNFTIEDTMSSGLTFVADSVEMKAGGNAIAKEPVVAVDEEKGTLTWAFIDREKRELDKTHPEQKEDVVTKNRLEQHGGEELVITYKAILNENCVVGGLGNPNEVSLTYNHNNSVVSVRDTRVPHEPKSRVYTFGIDITKQNGKGEKLEGVEFRLYEDEGLTKEVTLKKGEKGYYKAADGQDVITTGKDGRAYIYGLGDGTYYLKETKTNEKYILLKKSIQVTIEEQVEFVPVNDKDYPGEKGTYAQAGNYFQYDEESGSYREVTVEDITNQTFATGKFYTRNDEGAYEEAKTLKYAKITASSQEGFTGGDSIALTVVNNPRFTVPQTGGMGTWMFTVCGAVMIAAAACLILIRRKRSMAKQ